MKYVWEDLPERKNCFTVRNAYMVNLNTGKAIRTYSTNTKIAVVQKCVTPDTTWYRTADAVHHYLNYAFAAEDLGLPNEKAPSAHSIKSNTMDKSTLKSMPVSRIKSSAQNKNHSKKNASSNGGERKRIKGWLNRIFRRKNG